MKKLILILLINVYALAVFGIGIRQFYCCGILKSTDITLEKPSGQKCSEGDEKDGCCKVEYKNLKVKDSHFAASEVITPAKQIVSLHLFTPSLETALEGTLPKAIANFSHAPPPQPWSKLYILHCVYRI